MSIVLVVLAILTAGGVVLTERIDRPRRRLERIAAATGEMNDGQIREISR